MCARERADASGKGGKRRLDKFTLRTAITVFVTAVLASTGTWLVQRGMPKISNLVTPKPPDPCHMILAAPLTDDESGRRFQFLLVENNGDAPTHDFHCKISCVRTVDVAEVQVVDFNSTSSVRRTADAIHLDTGSIPAGGSVLMVIWHRLGGIEPADVAISWEGALKSPEIKYLQ